MRIPFIMSKKRQATTELNHENWDQDDAAEQEEMGAFKTAAKEVLEKRVIRTAKRRSQHTSDDAKRSIFSGFGGFNKTQPSSFDFLANLTNGSKAANKPLVTKNDTTVSASLFKASSSESVFSTAAPTNPTGIQSSSLFGASSTKTSSVFTTSKSDSTSESSFKIQSPSNTTNASNTPTISETSSNSLVSIPNPAPSTIFTTSKTDINKSILSTYTSTPFKIQSISSNIEESPKKMTNEGEGDNPKGGDKKLKYYNNLKGLNESVSEWIVKHVKETPLCILTPIFNDYDKHLKEIQNEYFNSDKEEKSKVASGYEESKSHVRSVSENTSVVSGNKSPFAPKESSNTQSLTDVNTQSKPFSSEEMPSFSFGINNSLSKSNTTPNVGFSFGVNTSTLTTSTANSFSFGTNTNTTSSTNGSPAFSFGINKSFSFNSNIQQPTTTKTTETEEDEPPKVEFTPIVEENSVYDKRCKIFIKKDGNFIDKGVGTLYIKKIEETGKHQLLVRANTNLGTVLLNLILGSAIPTQRMGKNNVMMVCIPTPDTKPPPTPILIRVKTSEEADELLGTLNKYKA